jgi:hypothetical protein
MEKRITIKNISSATVSLVLPYINFRRKLDPNRVINVSEDEYYELENDPGFAAMVREHYLAVKGLEANEMAEVVKGQVYEMSDISAMLDKLDITAFAKFIPTAAPAEKETVIKLAVDKGITNPAITALIKKYCDVDVISAINMKHQAEE